MGDIEHRHAEPRPQIGQQRHDLGLCGDVEPGRRLVQHHQIGAAGQRHRDADPLLLTAGELVRIAAAERLIFGQADQSEQRAGIGIGGLTMRAQTLADLCAHPHPGIERGGRVLRHIADVAPAQPVQFSARQIRQVLARQGLVMQRHASGLDPQSGVAVAQQLQRHRRFAAAGLADQTKHFAGPDAERDIFDHPDPAFAAPVSDGQAVNLQQWCVH